MDTQAFASSLLPVLSFIVFFAVLAIALAITSLLKLRAKNKTKRTTRLPDNVKSRGRARSYAKNAEPQTQQPTKPLPTYPSDRFFSPRELYEGHSLAGHQCEYTVKSTGKRCNAKSEEGDHFYPYSKGGATSLANFVSACKAHNQSKKAKIWDHEKAIIETRRARYYPPGTPTAVGAWREIGLRVIWKLDGVEYATQARDPFELARQFRLQLLKVSAYSASNSRVRKIITPADVADFVWKESSLFLVNFEGIDPVSGLWISLLKKPADSVRADSQS